MNELAKFDKVKADRASLEQENLSLVFEYEKEQGNKERSLKI